jgi:hypothetical protein
MPFAVLAWRQFGVSIAYSTTKCARRRFPFCTLTFVAYDGALIWHEPESHLGVPVFE